MIFSVIEIRVLDDFNLSDSFRCQLLLWACWVASSVGPLILGVSDRLQQSMSLGVIGRCFFKFTLGSAIVLLSSYLSSLTLYGESQFAIVRLETLIEIGIVVRIIMIYAVFFVIMKHGFEWGLIWLCVFLSFMLNNH